MRENKPIGFVIRSLSRMIGRRADSCAGRQYLDSLTGTNGWIIGYLAHNQGRDVYQKDIEEHFSVRRSTVSRVVTLMEQKGLIVRESVECDARLKKLVLTDKALEIHKSIESSLDEVEGIIVKGISEEDMETFLRVARTMMGNLCDGECSAGCHGHVKRNGGRCE